MSEQLKTQIKTDEDYSNMRRMIEKECQRSSLKELCESWGFDCEAFYHFLNLAEKGLFYEDYE